MRRHLRAVLYATCGLVAFAGIARADTVPEVVGLPVDAARPMLERAGFPARFAYDGTKPPGIVFSQEPGGLANRPRGKEIQVLVGGEAPAQEPAAAPVERPFPAPGPSETAPSGAAPPPGGDWPLELPAPSVGPGGAPPAGTPQVLGPPLDELTASATPEAGPNRTGPELPNTIQRTEAEAREALARWKLDVESTLATPDLVGRVLNQVPAPGEPLAPGETVTIVVGLASLPSIDHHVVPPVEGLRVAEARSRIEQDGFRVVLVSIPSLPDQSGRVIAQRPLPISLAVRGSDVVLRLGRGGHPAVPTAGPIRLPPAVPTGTAPGTPPSELGPPPGSDTETPGLPPPVPMPPPGTPVPVTPPGPPGPTPPSPAPPQPTPPGPVPPGPVPPSPTPGPAQPKPGTPQPVGPAEGSTFPRAYGATFQWTSVPAAPRYEWELQEEQAGSTWRTAATMIVKETRYRPPRMERGRFRWRVRALNDTTPGDWSGFFRLYVY